MCSAPGQRPLYRAASPVEQQRARRRGAGVDRQNEWSLGFRRCDRWHRRPQIIADCRLQIAELRITDYGLRIETVHLLSC